MGIMDRFRRKKKDDFNTEAKKARSMYEDREKNIDQLIKEQRKEEERIARDIIVEKRRKRASHFVKGIGEKTGVLPGLRKARDMAEGKYKDDEKYGEESKYETEIDEKSESKSLFDFWSRKEEEIKRLIEMYDRGEEIPEKYRSEGKLKSIGEQRKLLEKALEEAREQKSKYETEREEIERIMSMRPTKKYGPPTSEESDKAMKEWEEKKEKAEGEEKKYKCPVCGNKMDSPHGPCPVCGWTKKGKTHVYTNAIITIAVAAIIAFILPMIFGSDPNVLLISAGIIFVAMETLFGSGGAGGYVKAVFRTIGFLFIAFGFFFIFGQTPLLKVIPLFILAFEIVTYPMPEIVYTEEDKALQYMRMVLGVGLTVMFYLVFGSIMNANPNLLISFLFLSIAFFVAFPESKSNDSKSIDKMINAFYRAGEKMGEGLSKTFGEGLGGFLSTLIKYGLIGSLLLIVLLIFVGTLFPNITELLKMGLYGIGAFVGFIILIVGVNYSARKNSINGMMYGFFGGAGIMFGSLAFAPLPLSQGMTGYFLFILIVAVGIISAAPMVSARPLIGVPIIFLAIMSATIAYPDIMGQATFGVWWPTIDRTIENTLGPLQSTIMGPFASMQRGYACLADPVGCMQNYQPQTSTKEVPRAVEIMSLEPIGADSVTMPDQDLLVLLDVQNLGKDAAENIYVEPIQPMYSQGTPTGKEFGKATIIADNEQKSKYKIPKLLKNEIREFVLNYTFGEESGNKTYLRRGNFITYGAKIKYNYNVSAKLKVNIMNHDYYYNLAKNDKLTRAEQITEDTGGPVRLGIAVMKNEMPIPDNIGAKVPVMVYIENQGQGTIYKINNIYVDLTSLGGTYCSLDGEGGHKIEGIISGYLHKDVEPGKTLKGICFIELPSLEDDVDQKTYLITANMSYGYAFYKYNTIPVDFGAFAQCECVNKEDESKKDYILVYSCDECKDREGDICEGVFGDYEYNGNCIDKQKSD